MSTIEVPGAKIYYETLGSGPLLLLISGANGSGKAWQPVAQRLAAHYTVVSYDRRGFSRSHFTEAQDFANRLNTDADDAALLIKHLTSTTTSKTATVVGNSSGAIVSQTLLTRHPDLITTLIAHEPPSFSILPSPFREQALGLLNHVYTTYRNQGPLAATEIFAQSLGTGIEVDMLRMATNASSGEDISGNVLYWLEFEVQQYPSADVDLENLVKYKEKFVPAGGEDTSQGPLWGPIKILSQATGKEVVALPGGHIGFISRSEDWAKKILEILEGR